MKKLLNLSFAVLLLLLSSELSSQSKSIYEPLLSKSKGNDTLLSLALWEYGRVTGKGKLFSFLRARNPLVRLRTVEVIGRIQDPGDKHYMIKMLWDKDERVVGEAVFALGQMGTSTSVASLLRLTRKATPQMQMKIAEALGKIGGSKAVGTLKNMLHGFNSGVRGSAGIALARAADPLAVSSLLIAIHDQDPEVIWRVTYALENTPSKRVVSAVVPFLRHENAVVRAFAARTLGKHKAADAINELIPLLEDPRVDVAVNAARALGEIGEKKAIHPLGVLINKHPSHHVRKQAVESLHKIGSSKAKDYLITACSDRSPGVRTAAVKALAKVLGEQSEMFILMLLEDGDRAVRAAALESIGNAQINKKKDFLLLEAKKAEDPLMRAAAVRALGFFEGDEIIETLVENIHKGDWVVATEAVGVIGKLKAQNVAGDLIEAYRKRDGRAEVNIRMKILEVLKALEAPAAVELALEALDDSDRRIRSHAAELLQQLQVQIPEPKPERYFYSRDFNTSLRQSLALPSGVSKAFIQTRHGEIEIELFGDDAIQIVNSFKRLANQGFYDGLTFHRVVPNFVVQGGDPRGDGWGDAGYFVRSEFNQHTFKRGYVGIAHDGKDTGGSQFFITLSPQHHLDGRYTIFGRVIAGMDVVDKIDQGDSFKVSIETPDD